MNIRKHVSLGVVLATIAAFSAGIPVYADTNTPPSSQSRPMRGGPIGNLRGMMRPVVVGTVTAVSSNTVTVSGRQGFSTTTPVTTFSVDATNAKVMKNNANSSVSSIAVNDTVVIMGTISGTNVVATTIRDGVMMNTKMPSANRGEKENPTVQGNGQPIVAGAVGAVSGSTITIMNKSNVTYSVDASGAKILEGNKTMTLSDVKVGDMVLVQGAVNGNSVTASTVFDQTKPASVNASASAGAATQNHFGFLGGIGQFFGHMFGF